MIITYTLYKTTNKNIYIVSVKLICTSSNNQVETLFFKELENLVEEILMLFEKWKIALLLLGRVKALKPGDKHFERKNWFENKLRLIIECLADDINSCIKEQRDFFGFKFSDITIENRNDPVIPICPSTFEVAEKDVDKENLSTLASRQHMLEEIASLRGNRGTLRVHTHEWIRFSDSNLIINPEADLLDRFLAEFRTTRELA